MGKRCKEKRVGEGKGGGGGGGQVHPVFALKPRSLWLASALLLSRAQRQGRESHYCLDFRRFSPLCRRFSKAKGKEIVKEFASLGRRNEAVFTWARRRPSAHLHSGNAGRRRHARKQ